MNIIGIDPGAKGALMELRPDRDPSGADFGPWVLTKIGNLIGHIEKPHVFLEWPNPIQKLMPSVTGAFKMGCAFGEIVGALKVAKVPYTLVRPQQWQKVMLAGTPAKLKTKERARIRAAQLFPQVELYGPRGGYKDGRADALLIAEWGRRQLSSAPIETEA